MTKPLVLSEYFGRDSEADWIAHMWVTYNAQKHEYHTRMKELRNYIFATDTTTTSNSSLPWKNSTTLPKLCQIRDNLHSNYISALFPNDEWVVWEGSTRDDSLKQKADAIASYMRVKTRDSHFRTEISKLVYDYIDYGNAFATVFYEASFVVDYKGDKVPVYIGPRVKRISPYDIVFNPTASSFRDSWKITRSVKTLADLAAMAVEEPDNAHLQKAINSRNELRKNMNTYGIEENDKAEGFLMDGFGSYHQYLESDTVEILQFAGDFYDVKTNKLYKGRVIEVIDRMFVIRDSEIPNWLGHMPLYHVGWRYRQDNLWAMGPLENLVGLQYRIDHLENLKADAMDLAIHPPLVIKGEVEEFNYGPNEEIHIDENGSVEELARNVQWVIQANNEIAYLTQLMEQYVGAPSEAMGIRTPGEKTAFEVQQLQNAAGRIFQEKTTNFEVELLEPVLNAMLEVSKRNIDMTDVIRVVNDELGVTTFMDITRDDIAASGRLRPIGARHFAAKAQMVQNINGIFNSNIAAKIDPHVSSIKLAQLVEDLLGLNRFGIVRPNVAVTEMQETQRLMGQAQEDLAVEQAVPAQ